MADTVKNGVATRRSVRSVLGAQLRGIYRKLLAARYAGVASTVPGSDRNDSVLVIRGDAIGDFVLFLPALILLRKHYSHARMTLLVGRESADFASSLSVVDEVVIFDRARYRYDLPYRNQLIQRLRAKKFGIAVNPCYSREPLTDELLYCSGAPERIAFAGDLNNIDARTKHRNNRYCTHILPSDTRLTHELERNNAFVQELTGSQLPHDVPTISTLLAGHLHTAHLLFDRQGLNPRRDLIVAVSPGASNSLRMWPVEHFATLADHITATFGARVLLCGSPSDQASGEQFCRLVRIAPAANLIGSTTLTELAAVLHLSALFIGNESGPLHLAAAAGTPTVCIQGGGHFGRFYPYPNNNRHRAVFRSMPCYHCNWQCIYDEPRCIRDISVETAWETTRRLIEEVVLRERCFSVARTV
jgi:ADP-heptose:LPS heptosyltransferase